MRCLKKDDLLGSASTVDPMHQLLVSVKMRLDFKAFHDHTTLLPSCLSIVICIRITNVPFQTVVRLRCGELFGNSFFHTSGVLSI